MKGVTNVKVSLADARITIDAESNQAIPSLHKLNQLFNKDGYSFTLQPEKQAAKLTAGQVALVLVIFAIIVGLFTYFTGSDMLASLNVNSGSSLPAFFLFGIAAGLSSCAALVGGMLLSVQEAWVGSTDGNDKNAVMPFVLFNGSRLAAFALLGGLLGALGGLFRISFTASALLTIAIALVMLIIGMQMIGVKFFQRIKLNFTGGLVSSVANKGNLGRTVMPILFGAVTFFVPCGFTLVAQSQALASGSFARGLGVMTAFALGTLPVLLAISYSSIKFYRNPRFANPFRLLSGLLVIFSPC
jgi:sulfite exporter TauE/SafE